MRVLPLIALAVALAACSGEPPAEPSPVPAPEAAPAPAANPASPASDATEDVLTILYLGDSLTAGYGLAGGPRQAYPALIQERLDAAGISARTVNAGVSGDTSAGGLNRIGWYLDRHRVDVLVLALGANDGLRGLPVDALRRNLEAIIDRTREANPDVRVVLAGMMIPASMGGAYFQAFQEVFPAVAWSKDAELVPFLLEGVGGVRAMNQADGVHPTVEGQRLMAETVWQTLRPVVEEAYAAR
jgi:acyl-CoA thioesterase I